MHSQASTKTSDTPGTPPRTITPIHLHIFINPKVSRGRHRVHTRAINPHKSNVASGKQTFFCFVFCFVGTWKVAPGSSPAWIFMTWEMTHHNFESQSSGFINTSFIKGFVFVFFRIASLASWRNQDVWMAPWLLNWSFPFKQNSARKHLLGLASFNLQTAIKTSTSLRRSHRIFFFLWNSFYIKYDQNIFFPHGSTTTSDQNIFLHNMPIIDESNRTTKTLIDFMCVIII